MNRACVPACLRFTLVEGGQRDCTPIDRQGGHKGLGGRKSWHSSVDMVDGLVVPGSGARGMVG